VKINNNLEIFSLSDSGLKRTNNEDFIKIEEDIGLVILADGMGGYQSGEVASQLATTTMANLIKCYIKDIPNPKQHQFLSKEIQGLLDTAIIESNKVVYEKATTIQDYLGMGTTIVFAMFFDDRLIAGHVGDSKLFRYRYSELIPLTNDHSILQEQINSGMITQEQAKVVNYKNLVTRAIGIETEVELDLQEVDIMEGDIYLLCSDGLTDLVSNQEINNALINDSINLDKVAKNLVNIANQAGGKDNISVILVKVNAI